MLYLPTSNITSHSQHRSEGFGAVLLKRLDAAMRDGDHIYSVITGSSINSNGKGKSFTMPEGARQGDTIKQAYLRAKRSPSDAFFVELHATGTSVGDPIEANGKYCVPMRWLDECRC